MHHQAFAYTRTMAESGIPLYWNGANFSLAGNPTNSSGLSSADISQIFQNSFQSWANTGANIGFSYSQSNSSPRTSGYDGTNAIFFTNGSGKYMDFSVIATTEVLYYVSSGRIAEFDMAFNDSHFLFTTNPGDTGKYGGGKTKIYLQDVATHEAGHALGLDHSMVGKSSLIYTAFSGQYTLGDDDKTAVRTIYPSSGGTGSISGTVSGTSGGVFGTHVTAINLITGNIQAGALTNSDGTFRIGDLPPGQYSVMMEPFGTDVSSLSSYWRNINHRFCGYSKFRRSFYTSCSSNGVATSIDVQAGGSTNIGILSPKCANMGTPGIIPTSINTAKDISSSGSAMFGTLNTGDTHYYRLQNVSGNINVKAASYTLYSPVDVQVDILQSNGSPLAGATSIDNVENPMPGGYINYDSSATVNNLSNGTYIVRIRAANQRISSSYYPAGYDLQDSSGHYLLMVSVNGQVGISTTTDMSACVSLNNTAQSANISRSPSSNKEEVITGCGMTQGGGGIGGGGGNILSSSLFVILFTAFMSKFISQLARLRSKR